MKTIGYLALSVLHISLCISKSPYPIYFGIGLIYLILATQIYLSAKGPSQRDK